ncbi:MAG: hypothetical protein LUC97_01790, partial [Clostridiales bacterium]|nr:hypothetical protein [Clostridiales bacterium]
GAGIGGGYYANGSNITISGGTVTASGSSYGAGIGGGRYSPGEDSGGSGSGIAISGGTVTASSSYGAGIGGGGSNGDNNSKGSDIAITGGYIKASSEEGDCIGSGGTNDNSKYSTTAAENISISGGSFAVGSTSEGTVYGIAVESSCSVASNSEVTTKADYPYIVINPDITAFVVSGTTGTVGETGYTYENHVLTITKSGNWNIEMNTAEGINHTQTDRIVVDIEDGGDVGIYLTDVSISSSYSPLRIENGEVYLLLQGDNYLTSTGSSYAALSKAAGTPTLHIQSDNGINGTDSLTAQGGDNAAAIGGNSQISVSDIQITSGVITATAGQFGAAIGAGGYGDANNITISGGTVTATAGRYGAAIGGGYYSSALNEGVSSDITISGGYIKLSSRNGDLIGNGYGYTGGDAENIVITGGYFGEGSVDDQTVYGIAVDDDYFVGLNTDSGTSEDYPYMVNEFTGDLVITGAGITKGTDYKYTYSDGLTILKSGEYNISMASGAESTSDRIVVDTDGDVELTISGINIINEDNSPFSAESGNLTLILEGDNYLTASSSTNEADDGINYAALSKPGDTYSLTITSIDGDGSSKGSLTASGSMYGAGIGGGSKTSSGNITISGGTVNTSGGMFSAGIGGGLYGNGTDITISGGTVTASSPNYGAGIGGGYTGEGSNIEITGGTVDASGNTAAGIGGGAKGTGSDIAIYGGDVTASASSTGAAIGGGEEGSGSNIAIYDGNVTASGGTGGAGIGGGYNADGSGITITGGTVSVSTSGDGAAIGGGSYANGTDITISGGYITAKAYYSLYIGGGYNGSGSNINIIGGYFGKGDTEANTIYGITLDSKYTVTNNTDADTSTDYPYTITKSNDLVITGESGITEGEDYTYDNYVLTVLKSGAYTVTMASWTESTETDRIVIDADGDVELTISDINTTSSSESPISSDGGDLTLILDGDNCLTTTNGTRAALSKSAENSLTITSIDGDGSTNGSLTADASNGKAGAGIGGDYAIGSGSITIAGGTVTASALYGAGIGSGRYSSSSDLTIIGGNVTATSTHGAGIGSSQASDGGTESSGITITGGTVTAASTNGAGIGAGCCKASDSISSGVTITGGFVTATSTHGAGIGSGQNTASGSSKASGIIITGGTVTASGYYGIGCGKSDSGSADAPTIDGGSVKVTNGFTTEPVNSGGSSLYLYEITDTAEGEAIYIDGSVYIPSVVHHESSDTSQYLYLPETSETGLVYTDIDTAKYYDLSYENSTSSAEYNGSVVLLTVDGETLILDETGNVDTSGITVVTDNGVLSGIQVDSEVYGGENGTYLDIVGVSVDGVFYQLENYYYIDDTEQYAFFPVTRNSSESKDSSRVRGAVGTKPDGADSGDTVYYITEGSDGLTIKEKE